MKCFFSYSATAGQGKSESLFVLLLFGLGFVPRATASDLLATGVANHEFVAAESPSVVPRSLLNPSLTGETAEASQSKIDGKQKKQDASEFILPAGALEAMKGTVPTDEAFRSTVASITSKKKVRGIEDSVLSMTFETPITQKSIAERKADMVQLGVHLEELSLILSNTDTSFLPSAQENFVIPFQKLVQYSQKYINNAANFMEPANPGEESLPGSDESFSQDDLKGVIAQNQGHRRTTESRSKSSADEGSKFGEGKDSKKKPWSGRYARLHDIHTNPKYEHIHKFKEAAISGDHGFAESVLHSYHSSCGFDDVHNGGETSFHGRRMQNEGVSKLEQCELLVKCAHRMSVYDLLIYFISDDIDPASGEIDPSILTFDEKFLREKRDRINELVGPLRGTLIDGDGSLNGGAVNQNCDTLLQHFHRVVEHDGLPRWEGGTVSQVCLAEGTTVYVKLEEIMIKIDPFFENFGDSTTGVAGDITKTQIEDSLALEVLEETLDCAGALFDSDDRKNSDQRQHENEKNVFRNEQNERTIPVGLKEGGNRDQHGQLTADENGTVDSGFETKTLAEMIDEAHKQNDLTREDCDKEVENEENQEEKDKKRHECVLKGWTENIKKLFGNFTKGLAMVFGDKPSPGYICGTKTAVVNDALPLNSTCCLDAPYQLDNALWGTKYQCSDECKTFAPYFGKIGEESCNVYGGTYCPRPDCSDLKQCIREIAESAKKENRTAFVRYLSNAPNITDPFSVSQCGRSRQYFGFPPNFINDAGICEDVKQLRYARDFENLQDFFNHGSKEGGGAGAMGARLVLRLEPPDHTESSKAPVQNGQAWRATNFALKKYVDGIQTLWEWSEAFKCPMDVPFLILHNICLASTSILQTIIQISFGIAKLALDISEFTYGEVAELDNIKPMETGERIKAIYPNMARTAKFLSDVLAPSLTGGRTNNPNSARMLGSSTAVESVSKFDVSWGVGCDGLDQDGIKGADNCEEDLVPPTLKLRTPLASTSRCDADVCFDEYFGDTSDAIAFLDSIFQVFDDCADSPNVKKSITRLAEGGHCKEARFHVTPFQTFPQDSGACSDLSGDPVTVKLGLDDQPPTVSCGFRPSSSGLKVSNNGRTLLVSVDQRPLSVDTGLYFDIQENCPGNVDVSVSVSTNELVHGPDIAVLVNMNHHGNKESPQAKLVVTPQSCADGSQTSASICQYDPVDAYRRYQVEVKAVDGAGNVATDTCVVVVESSSSRDANDGDDSARRRRQLRRTSSKGAMMKMSSKGKGGHKSKGKSSSKSSSNGNNSGPSPAGSVGGGSQVGTSQVRFPLGTITTTWVIQP